MLSNLYNAVLPIVRKSDNEANIYIFKITKKKKKKKRNNYSLMLTMIFISSYNQQKLSFLKFIGIRN